MKFILSLERDIHVKSLLSDFSDILENIWIWAIPSHLSLDRNVLQHFWGADNIPLEKLNRYIERRYQYNIELYRYFYTLQKNQELSSESVMVLRYDSLIYGLAEAFEKIVDFTGIRPSEAMQEAIVKQAESQQHYKRKHKVKSLTEFNLSKERLTHDLSFVFEQYGFEKELEQQIVEGKI